jgi:HrpA-like RNA helicase
MSLQRKGRVGRKHDGVFFPLFTEKTFNSMIEYNTPNIIVENMTSHMLALFANEPISSFDRMPIYDMLTPPSDDSINYSIERLFLLGAIDTHGEITQLGKMMNAFRKMNIESCKMILSGLVYGASIKELVCLACLLTIRKTEIVMDRRDSGVAPYDAALLFDELYQITPTFDRSKCDTMNFNRLKAKLVIGCEMLELLLIYQRFTAKVGTLSITALKNWCIGKGLNYFKLCKLTETIDETYWTMLDQLKINPVRGAVEHEELYQILKRAGDIDNTELIESVIKLKRCIYEGYKANILIWDDKANSYKTTTGLSVSVNSTLTSNLSYQKLGAQFEQDHPRMLVYKELLTRQGRDGLFANEASVVSVMDGYVNVDLMLAQS